MATSAPLSALGVSDRCAAELQSYGESCFSVPAGAGLLGEHPTADEPFVSAWVGYERESASRGVVPVLRERLVQLRFPIAPGTSESEAYRAATRHGDTSRAPDAGVALLRPDLIRLRLHQTPAGRIPVIIAEQREDFESLVRAFTGRNEPRAVPSSMGAVIVGGYNNWDRVAVERRAWSESPAAERIDATWAQAFARMTRDPSRYQDRFIVLSTGPYSGSSAATLGLDAATWRAMSLTIRLEHECAHYFTRRTFGSMRNSVVDELIADYNGLAAATGRFRASWFLQFMGLEDHPRFRAGGRLENYRGTPPLSDDAFDGLTHMVVRAAVALERFVEEHVNDAGALSQRALMMTALAMTPLARLASDAAREHLRDAYFSARASADGGAARP